jgi:FdhD protein
MRPAAARVHRYLVDRQGCAVGDRAVPEEIPVAFTFDRKTYAVMMASPADLEDFAIGFSFTERIVRGPTDIGEIEVVELPKGVELRMTLAGSRLEQLQKRARRFAGPAGCGLCGIESLEEAVSPPPDVTSSLTVDSATIFRAMQELRDHQPLNALTRSVHAAGFWSLAADGFAAVREDVGRHNALDKLAGALLRACMRPDDGFIVLTSRVSIELVQKCAILGCPLLVAISARIESRRSRRSHARRYCPRR